MSCNFVTGKDPTDCIMSSGETEGVAIATEAAGRGTARMVVTPPRAKAITSAPANFNVFTGVSYVFDEVSRCEPPTAWAIVQLRRLPSCAKPSNVEVRKVTEETIRVRFLLVFLRHLRKLTGLERYEGALRAFSNNWSGKIEGLYFDRGSVTVAGNEAPLLFLPNGFQHNK